MKQKFLYLWGYTWRPLAAITLFGSIFASLALPNFNALRSFSSPFETPETLNIGVSEDLLHSVVFLPQRAIQFLLLEVGLNEIIYLRLVSVFISVFVLLMFFYILRHWFTMRVALMGSFLFGISSWFLHQSRSAEPDIMYMFGAVALIFCVTLLSKAKNNKFLPLIALLGGILLYIPGFWLFMLVGCIFAKDEILRAISNNSKKVRVLSVSIISLCAIPLIYGVATSPSQIQQILGVPSGGILGVDVLIDNFVSIPPQLLISGIDEPLKWLIGTPILDVFTVAMLILGAYSMRVGLHPIRARALLIITMLSIVLIIFNGPVSMGALLPTLYLLAACGIGMMLRQWFSVFPRNPIARNFGVACVCFSLLIVGYYHANRYFIAWPKAYSTTKVIPDTR